MHAFGNLNKTECGKYKEMHQGVGNLGITVS